MKSAIRRGVKYARKLDGVVAESRLNALKDQQRINYEASMGKQIQLDSWIKSLHLGRNEVYYIIFAKQINKLMGKFRGDTLLEEVCGKKDLWQTRGLSSDTLDNIISRFNIGACEPVIPCADWDNEIECEANGCYWWNGACHDNAATCVDYDTELECEAEGCYWWNGSCHTNAPTCEDYDTQVECEAEGCYWYDGSCHTNPPPEDCFEQPNQTGNESLHGGWKHRCGQKITISNKVITKLGFWLMKGGSPSGAVTFTIRKTSDDSIINSKVAIQAENLTASRAYYEVEFDTPVNVNEEVYMLAEYAGAEYVVFYYQGTDVCAGIYVDYKGGYTEHATRDAAFKYCWTTA